MSDESPLDFFNENAGTMALLGGAAVNRNISATNEEIRKLQKTLEDTQLVYKETQRANAIKQQTAEEKNEVLFLFIKRSKEIINNLHYSKAVKYLLLEKFELFFLTRAGLKTTDFSEISHKQALSDLKNEISKQRKDAFEMLDHETKEQINHFVIYSNTVDKMFDFIHNEKQIIEEKYALDTFPFPSSNSKVFNIETLKSVIYIGSFIPIFIWWAVGSILQIIITFLLVCSGIIWWQYNAKMSTIRASIEAYRKNIEALQSKLNLSLCKRNTLLGEISRCSIVEKNSLDFLASAKNSVVDKEKFVKEHRTYCYTLAGMLGLSDKSYMEYRLNSELMGLEVTEYCKYFC